MSLSNSARADRIDKQFTPISHNLREFILGPQTIRLASGTDADAVTVRHIQELGAKAGAGGDMEAAYILLEIARGAVQTLNRVAWTHLDMFRTITRSQVTWPIAWSCIPSVRADLLERVESLELGTCLGKASEVRLPFQRNNASYIAHKVLTYMMQVHEELQDNDDEQWMQAVRALAPFGPETAEVWWPVAVEEINRWFFPNLHDWVLPQKTKTRTYGEAIRFIRAAFLSFKDLIKFPMSAGGPTPQPQRPPNPPNVGASFAAWASKNLPPPVPKPSAVVQAPAAGSSSPTVTVPAAGNDRPSSGSSTGPVASEAPKGKEDKK